MIPERGSRLLSTVSLFTLTGLLLAAPAQGFPPYRSTDAETAAPWVLEARLGLLKLERDEGHTNYTSPLLRLNFGFPGDFEIVSEFEYDASESRVGEAAVGFKWAPIQRSVSFGVETLALLPVANDHSGLGVESQLIATLDWSRYQVHINAGGFHDARPEATENGWRAGLLAEATFGRLKPGLELFGKQTHRESTELQLGPGLIFDAGPFKVRFGVHAGLTSRAPDFVTSLWFTTKFPFRRSR